MLNNENEFDHPSLFFAPLYSYQTFIFEEK